VAKFATRTLKVSEQTTVASVQVDLPPSVAWAALCDGLSESLEPVVGPADSYETRKMVSGNALEVRVQHIGLDCFLIHANSPGQGTGSRARHRAMTEQSLTRCGRSY